MDACTTKQENVELFEPVQFHSHGSLGQTQQEAPCVLLHSQLWKVLQSFWHTTNTTLSLQVWLLFISLIRGAFVRIYFHCLHCFV